MRGAERDRRGLLGRVLAVAVIAVAPAALFLGRYAVGGTGVAPVGSDTPQHVWRSEVVAELGLEALPDVDADAHALLANADRPGLPVVVAVVMAATGRSASDVAYVLPALLAVAIAAGAAAVAAAIPGVSGWGIVAAALATGTSVHVALAANGYLDQLLVAPLLLGAAAAALRAAGGGPGRAVCALCLVAAFLTHWQFAAVFAALLLLVLLACLPESIRGRGSGPPLDSPAGRLGVALGVGVVGGIAGLLLLAPGLPRLPTAVVRGSSAVRGQSGLYRLPVAVAAAVSGAASLVVVRGDPDRRRAAWLLVPWALLPAAAWALFAAGFTVPVQRALSFALAIPLLGGLFVAVGAEWLRRRVPRPAAAVTALAAAAAVAASAWLGWEAWRSRRPWSEDARLAEFRALGAYLAEAGRPAVIVVDAAPGGDARGHGEFGTVPVLRRIRAELPARLALRTTVYLGEPDTLLRDRPTLRPDVAGFDRIARDTWRAARPLLSGEPTIVVLRSRFAGFAAAIRDHPGWVSNGWMAVVSGPPPPVDAPAAPIRPPFASLVWWWAAAVLVVGFAGAGWAGRLGDGPVLRRLAAAPAVGLAAAILAGTLAERLGVRIGGPGGVGTVIAIGFVGAAAAATRPRERKSP